MNQSFFTGILAAGLLASLAVLAFVLVSDENRTSPAPIPTVVEVLKVASPTPNPCGIDAINRAAQGVVRVEDRYGAGSGFLISRDLVVTSQHVTDGARSMTIHFPDGGSEVASVLAESAALDLAVLRLRQPRPGIQLLWGDAVSLKPAQTVIAIGYPFSARGIPVLTKGAVSRVGRNALGEEWVQTDAAINPGNSGGPLIDECGLVVGVVTFKNSRAEGAGYAIAESQARPEIERLSGSVARVQTPSPPSTPQPTARLSSTQQPAVADPLESAVRSFYAAINRQDLTAAHGLLSSRHRSLVPLDDWRKGYSGTLGVTVDRARRLSGINEVEVAITVVDRDGRGGITTRRFAGNWLLTLESGRWYLDSARIDQVP